jgi:hypothetical protein
MMNGETKTLLTIELSVFTGILKENYMWLTRNGINLRRDHMGPCEAHLTTYGKVKKLAIGSFGEWSDGVHIVIKACAACIAHFTWQESGYSNEEDAREDACATACAILTTYCFKKLAILSLREVAVFLRNTVSSVTLYNIYSKNSKMKETSSLEDFACPFHTIWCWCKQ